MPRKLPNGDLMYSDYDLPPSVGTACLEKSLTRQSEAEACDVNVIVRRFVKSGELPYLDSGVFADVSELGDYRTVVERVREGTAYFDQLPVEVKDRFGNDPAAFMDFASDPGNRDELVAMKLLPPIVVPAEAPVSEPPSAA